MGDTSTSMRRTLRAYETIQPNCVELAKCALRYLEREDQVAELEQGFEVQLNADLISTCILHTDMHYR